MTTKSFSFILLNSNFVLNSIYMPVIFFIKKLFSILINYKFLAILSIYSIIFTSLSVYYYNTNFKPRLSYLENTIRMYGLDYQDGRGVYCVVESGCNKSINTREMITNISSFKDSGSINPFNTSGVFNTIDAVSSQTFQSIASSSTSVIEPKAFPTFYGFIGGDKIKLDLKQTYTNGNNIEGNYFSASENKTYKLAGRINSNFDNSTGYNGGNISMNEFENESISGKMDIYSDKPQNLNSGNNFVLSNEVLMNNPSKYKKLFGTYNSTDGIQYDLYLTQDEAEIDNWKTEKLLGKLYNNNANGQSVFLKVGDKYYYSKNLNKFKNIPNESEVTVTTKARLSYQSDYYMDRKNTCTDGGCNQPGFNSKDLMFNTTEVTYNKPVETLKSNSMAISSI